MSLPRITLRQSDIDEIHRYLPVSAVQIHVAEEDWEPFLAVAYEGMEIPVRVEEQAALKLTAVLVGADCAGKTITVVI